MKRYYCMIWLIAVWPLFLLGQRIQPSDLEYMGSFRLPDGSGGSDWNYSGTAMTYYPDGDPGGPDDGFPGSIFAVGHDQQMMLSEISIPDPIISSTKNTEELSMTQTLQSFQDIRNSNYAFVDPYNIPVMGLAYLPAQGTQTSGKLHFCWGQHIQFQDPSHGWCELNLSNPQTAGPWHFGNYNNYTTSDFLFEIPTTWADHYAPGQILASGRFREGVWSGFGPSLFACAPWEDGNPPSTGETLHHITLLLRYGTDDPSIAEIVTSENMKMQDYNMVDDWSGGAWLTADQSSAVIFVGTKGFGEDWYGFSDGTVWPYEGPYPPVPAEPHNQRGFWAERIEGRIVFYDPIDFGKVAQGSAQSYEPQPYATFNLDPFLYDPGYDYYAQKIHLLGACCYDRQRNFLYIIERLADEDKSLIHVFHIRGDGTSVRTEFNPLEYRLLQNYPNPFNEKTVVRYQLSEGSRIEINLLDLRGREVTSVFQGYKPAGEHRLVIDAKELISGIYFIQLVTGEKRFNHKMILIR
ncbi:T9SS type A sorting domain-containing protein [bacterium]